MSAKPVFLLASANPSEDQADLRKDLDDELNGIRDLLFQNFRSDLQVEFWPQISTEQFIYLAESDISQRIVGFHYAGHGELEALLFQDRTGHADRAHTAGLESYLERWPLLRLAFLNCCLSGELASRLQASDRLVIGSPYVLDSQAAREMALGFYGNLVRSNKRIQEAVDGGIRRVKLKVGEPDTDGVDRGLIKNSDFSAVQTVPQWDKVWKLYPEDADLLEKKFSEELRWLRIELRRPASQRRPEQLILETGLSIDFQSQETAIDNMARAPIERPAEGYLMHGSTNFGVPWLRYRILRHRLPQRKTINIDFERITSEGKSDEIWAKLGKELDASHPITREGTILAAAQALAYNLEDIVVLVDNALVAGPDHLATILEDFWEPLAEGVDAYWQKKEDGKPMRRLWGLFFAEYPDAADRDLQLEPTLRLAAGSSPYFAILEGTRSFTQDEIKAFLALNGNQIFLPKHRPDLNNPGERDPYFNRSNEIYWGANQGVPELVLDKICQFSGTLFKNIRPDILGI